MDADKSYVTIEKCLICRGDTGALVLDKRMRPTFEMRTSFPNSVCRSCRKKYIEGKGVMLLDTSSGKLVVIKDEAFKRIFNAKIPSSRISLVDENMFDKMGIKF